jgi:hypothetical protein
MKIKTSELTGPALDWAVAKCNGIPLVLAPFTGAKNFVMLSQGGKPTTHAYEPSTSWAQGGPIIDKMGEGGLILMRATVKSLGWRASLDFPNRFCFGLTPLIAAMRCYVASKLGDEIEIPEELQ